MFKKNLIVIKDFFKKVKEYIKEEYKFILMLLFTYILFTWPVNYYIVVGGGISDIDSRIKVEDGYKSKGSFNISYVSEMQGRFATYLLSYVIPSWERISVNEYKYDTDEEISDIEFRSALDLKTANGNAIKHAYQLAGAKYEEVDTKIYVVVIFDEYDTKLRVGDQLLSINGKSFDDILAYKEYLQGLEVGEIVEVKVIRNEKEKVLKTPLYDYKGNKILGVSLQIVNEYKTEPDVDIKFKSTESGPSGGLITTLDIYNKLTKRDLTKSLKIAGTGTIEADGSIGSIGGVSYKLLGAVDGGADVFLVPKGDNYKECMKMKKKKKLDIKVIPVETFSDAVAKLEKLEK